MARKIRDIRKRLTPEPAEEIIATSTKVSEYLRENARPLVVGVLLVFAIAGIAFAWQVKVRSAERESLEIVAKALSEYRPKVLSGGSRREMQEICEKTTEQLTTVVEEYPGTRVAPVALFYLGECRFHSGDYDEAVAFYSQVLDQAEKVPHLEALALSGLGYAHEEKGDYEKAIEFYKRSDAAGEFGVGAVLLVDIARCYEALGRTPQALESYRQFLKDFPNAERGPFVKARVAELGKREEGTPAS